MTRTLHWWQKTTIYQIYPRSFADSNNDGIGDLRGIISKLDYIKDLGFETIWISPFFSSPQQDFGYDISDFKDVAPEYGTLAEVDELISEVHQRGMRVLFDLVLNHTSDQHPWFQESRSSLDNPKRNWYIWQDGRGTDPPNNWKAIPGGSGWHFDKVTDQWYFASFLPFQPDLNWHNPEVKQTMLDIFRFWLDRGVDGYRLDIFHSVFKDAQFRDNPFSYKYLPKNGVAGFFQEWRYSLHQSETYTLARELRTILDSYSPERMMVGEVFGDDTVIKRYIGDKLDGFNVLFSWDLMNFKTSAHFLQEVIRHYETHFPSPYTPVYVFGNHDVKRLASQIEGNPRIAKLLALFQFTVRGLPVTYYGEEIGMVDGKLLDDDSLDPIAQRYKRVPQFVKDLLGVYTNRDGCRTPMQWDNGLNAGFCNPGGTPWLPVHENRTQVNVRNQQDADDSILNTYKRLLLLRREVAALHKGSLELLDGPEVNKNLLVYKRVAESETVLVVINFSKKRILFRNPTTCDRILLAVGMDQSQSLGDVQLPPFSGILFGN